MSHPLRHGRVRVPVLVGLLAAALAQPTAALAQETPEPTPVPSVCKTDAAAAVGTDKPIYANFETVTITGSGYAADCALEVEVEDPAQAVASYDATTDATGAFTATHVLADVDGTYVVRVRDAASGEVLATHHFVDGFELKALYDGTTSTRLFDAGDTVKAVGTLDNKKIWRWIVRRPNGSIADSTPCSTRTTHANQQVEHSFTLPANEPATGEKAWRFDLLQYGDTSVFGIVIKSAEAKCAEGSGEASDQLKFRVSKASTFADASRSETKYWFKPGERAYVSLAGLSPNNNWSVAWYDGTGALACRNVHGEAFTDGRPDVGNSGVLETLVYAPFPANTAGVPSYNEEDAYWNWPEPASGKCDPTTDGEWEVEVNGYEWNPRDVAFGGLTTDPVSKRFKAFGVDGTPPSITAEYLKGWQNAPVTVTLKDATDNLSGVEKVEWRKPGGAWTAYDPAAKPQLAHGEKLQYVVVDKAGNVFADETEVAQVDTDAPVTTATLATTDWSLDPVEVTLEATDAKSGVDKIEYRKAGSSTWLTYDAAAKPTLGNGEQLEYRATDKVGNTEATKTTAAAKVDGDAPTTTATLATTDWSKTPVEVTLTADDGAGSGVVEVEYRKAGSSTWLTYDPAAKPTLGNGEQLEFRAIDDAGNVEATKTTAAAKVDADAPTTTATLATTDWSKTLVEVTLTADDGAGSGIDKVEYRLVGTTTWLAYDAAAKPTLNDGQQLEFRATDKVGNEEAAKTSAAAKVDPDAPVTTATFNPDWSNGPVDVTLTATDAKSGVDKIEYRKAGSAAWLTYDAAAKPTLNDGEQLEFRATDKVGNEEATKSTANAKVDTDAPTTTATLASGWQKAAVPVQLAATDAKSGVDKIEVRIAGAATWATYDDAARPTLTHGQALEYRATDKVGNTETTKVTAPAQVDGQAPTTTDDVPAGEVDGPTAVTLTATDAGPSGLGTVEWRKAGQSAWTVYAANAKPVLANGERLEYRATDVAGNAEAVKQSAALKVKAPVTGTDTNRDAVVTASSASRSSLPTITNLAISPACMVGMTFEAPTAGRKAVTLSYVLGGGATQVEITIQKRDPSAARKDCATTKNVRKPGAKYETVEQRKVAGKDGSATSDIGSHDAAATARAANAKATKTVKKIVARRSAKAGRNSVPLAKLASGKQLAPGTYRVLVVAIDASGRRSAPAKAIFRVASGR